MGYGAWCMVCCIVYSLTALSLLSRCSLTALSLLSHCSLTAPSLLSPCSLTALSLLPHCSLTALSLLSHCSLTAPSLLPHQPSVMKDANIWYAKGLVALRMMEPPQDEEPLASFNPLDRGVGSRRSAAHVGPRHA
jgi:hypothetical protein